MCNLYLCDAPVFSDKPHDKEKISTSPDANRDKILNQLVKLLVLLLERDKEDNLC